MRTTETSETLTATTARPITFATHGDPARRTLVTATRTFPAGTTVYARLRRDGLTFAIRVAGTLYTQDVYASALIVP